MIMDYITLCNLTIFYSKKNKIPIQETKLTAGVGNNKTLSSKKYLNVIFGFY